MSTGREAANAGPTHFRMGIEQFVDQVGMSARSIRAYHARGLLPPPERIGKRVYYVAEHVKRVKAIQRLQRQGLNLAAISALFGEGSIVNHGAASRSVELTELLTRMDADDPSVSRILTEHGVLGRAITGEIVPLRPRLIRSALALQSFGIPAKVALRIVTDVLDQLRDTADDLAEDVGKRIVSCIETSGPRDTGALGVDLDAQRLNAAAIAVLDEAFRIVIEASCTRRLLQVLDERNFGGYANADVPAVDVG
jgi:DNA-binding transcriptional MerR regulator